MFRRKSDIAIWTPFNVPSRPRYSSSCIFLLFFESQVQILSMLDFVIVVGSFLAVKSLSTAVVVKILLVLHYRLLYLTGIQPFSQRLLLISYVKRWTGSKPPMPMGCPFQCIEFSVSQKPYEIKYLYPCRRRTTLSPLFSFRWILQWISTPSLTPTDNIDVKRQIADQLRV